MNCFRDFVSVVAKKAIQNEALTELFQVSEAHVELFRISEALVELTHTMRLRSEDFESEVRRQSG